MNGSLVPLRIVALLVGIIVAIALATGYLYYNGKPYACYTGFHYQNQWFTTVRLPLPFAKGELDIRQRPYDCNPGEKYDPTQANPNQTLPAGVVPQ